MSAVTNFRHFANTLREEPLQYTFVVTECKGAANIIIGSLQLIISEWMKRSSNPYYKATLAPRHVEIGTEALKRGLGQILPGAIMTTGAYLAYHTWTQN